MFTPALRRLALALSVLPVTAAPLAAQSTTVLPGDHSVSGQLCVGLHCASDETFFDIDMLKLNYTLVSLLFEDTDSAGFPSNDWRLLVNDGQAISSGGISRFSVQDVDASTIPFTIEAGAAQNSLWIAPGNQIGLGTSLPQQELHIYDFFYPVIRFERSGQNWDFGMVSTAFGLKNIESNDTIVSISSNAERNMISIVEKRFGISTSVPDANLHIDTEGSDPYAFFIDKSAGTGYDPKALAHIHSFYGDAQLLIEDTWVITEPRTLLNLQNNGRPEITMGNTSTGGEWSFGAGNNFVLKTGAIGSTDAEKTLHLKLFGATGNMEITGQIITGGGTCGGGCDAVFSPDYELPSIQAHADAMWKLGHLPNVGPTIENQPINVSDKLGRMLNELEHAHIYIAELEQRDRKHVADLADQRALLNALQARLARLEAAQPVGATGQ